MPSSPMASLVVATMEMMVPEMMMEGKRAVRVVAIIISVWIIGISVNGVPCATRQR